MFFKRFRIFKLLGFQVWIDWSWFILALLITWSLATHYFPSRYDEIELNTTTRWGMGAVGTIGIFVSIVLHELGHSVVARRFGMQMRGITLFIFGGVAEMSDEPPNATAEFYVAIAGPIVSIFIGTCLLMFTLLGTSTGWAIPVVGVTGWVGWMNFVLVIFNMVPAFPLDGGRVLRAVLWHRKGDLRRATQISSGIGGMFGTALIILGVLSFIWGNVIGGIWWVVLGLFLRTAAIASYKHVLIRDALEGELVERFMSRSPIAVPSDISIRQLIDEYFYQYYHKMYPVVDSGTLSGCVSIADIKSIPKDEWEVRTVRDIAKRCTDENTADPTDDVMHVFAKLNRSGVSRLLVVDHAKLVGVLSLKDIMRFLSLKTDLDNMN